eukprot:9490753-Pyramimonas_sp.AAC.1
MTEIDSETYLVELFGKMSLEEFGRRVKLVGQPDLKRQCDDFRSVAVILVSKDLREPSAVSSHLIRDSYRADADWELAVNRQPGYRRDPRRAPNRLSDNSRKTAHRCRRALRGTETDPESSEAFVCSMDRSELGFLLELDLRNNVLYETF